MFVLVPEHVTVGVLRGFTVSSPNRTTEVTAHGSMRCLLHCASLVPLVACFSISRYSYSCNVHIHLWLVLTNFDILVKLTCSDKRRFNHKRLLPGTLIPLPRLSSSPRYQTATVEEIRPRAQRVCLWQCYTLSNDSVANFHSQVFAINNMQMEEDLHLHTLHRHKEGMRGAVMFK